MVSDQQFSDLYSQWSSYLFAAAQRMSIPGKLDSEDQNAEAVELLWSYATETEHDLTSDDFRKEFKTRLWHRLTDNVRRMRAGRRDVTREINVDQMGSDGLAESDASYWTSGPESVHLSELSSEDDPADIVEAKDSLRVLYSLLDQRDASLLTEMLQPSDELLELQRQYLEERGWSSSPIPFHLFGRAVSMSYKQARLSLTRIRRAATVAFGREDLLSCAVA